MDRTINCINIDMTKKTETETKIEDKKITAKNAAKILGISNVTFKVIAERACFTVDETGHYTQSEIENYRP